MKNLEEEKLNMYSEEIEVVSKSAQKKVNMINEKWGKYALSCMLGGLYVCFGIILAYSLGGVFYDAHSHYGKIVIGLTFGIALTLITFGGADLFTSNTLVMSVGAIKKKTSWKDYLKIVPTCWIFNFVGTIIGSLAFVYAGVMNESNSAYIVKIAESKLNLTIPELLIRGILCNLLICLATWLSYKMKNEVAKIIMMVWCILTFVIGGFEHSIANMGIFALALLLPQSAGVITLSGIAYNLFFVTIGNIIAGTVILAFSYTYMCKKK